MRSLIVLSIASLFLVPAVSGQAIHTIAGRVVDQHGDPVAGADVYLYQYGSYDGEAKPMPANESSVDSSSDPAEPERDSHQAKGKTDGQGYYVLQARSGYATVSAQKEGYAYAWSELQVDGAESHDIKMTKYPERTVNISGTINVHDASISIEYPEFGLYACSMYASDKESAGTVDSGSTSSSGSTEPASDAMIARPYDGCDITIQDDGSYSGQVYPGYAVLRVYHDLWRSCPDGTCQSYYSSVQTLHLEPGDRRVDVNLKARPAPDAELKGYVLDAADEPVAGVYLSFSHQDSYAYGQGKTDQDGSFRVAVRSGLVEVSVWADGYLPWHGMVEASKDGELLVIRLTEGQSQYGGYCCYAYAEGDAVKTAAGAPAMDDSALQTGGLSEDSGASRDDATGVRDLGGGLGPYQLDAEQSGRDAPGATVLALLAAIAVALVARRR